MNVQLGHDNTSIWWYDHKLPGRIDFYPTAFPDVPGIFVSEVVWDDATDAGEFYPVAGPFETLEEAVAVARVTQIFLKR